MPQAEFGQNLDAGLDHARRATQVGFVFAGIIEEAGSGDVEISNVRGKVRK